MAQLKSGSTVGGSNILLDVSDSVDASNIAANAVNASELNVSGNGTTSQYLRSDGDGTFTWAAPTNTTYTAGTGLGLSGTTFSHSDTSSQASSNNSGSTFIQDITLDGYGHITAIGTGVAGGGISNVEIFTTSGTWNYSAAGSPNNVYVTVIGGGGGSHGSEGYYWRGSGGGGGGSVYMEKVAVSANVTVTVGAGGALGGRWSSGGTGGTSSFGTVIAYGGSGGVYYHTTTGDPQPGGSGGGTSGSVNGLAANGSNGGSSHHLGHGGSTIFYSNYIEGTPAGYGVGASGPRGGAANGWAGAPGCIIVMY